VLLAADRGHANVIQVLVDAGAPLQPSEKSPTREAALHYAVINGHEAIVDILLAKGADVNYAVCLHVNVGNITFMATG